VTIIKCPIAMKKVSKNEISKKIGPIDMAHIE
jgi:hypothetical protein